MQPSIPVNGDRNMNDQPLMRIRDLRVSFSGFEVVHGVDLDVSAGEVLAVVGESGSGKSVTSMAPLQLLSVNAEVSGYMEFGGTDLLNMKQKALRQIRGAEIALISQDPVASLNPVFTVGFQLMESIRAHGKNRSRAEVKARALELLEMVEVPDPSRRLRQYPHQLSGGQCQRIGIAMALACDPRLLIADEPTTALDVTVQAEVLEVLARLGRQQGLGILLITHDMGIVADIANRVVVMRNGRVVESGDVYTIFSQPQEQYTQSLLSAVPRIGVNSAKERQSNAKPVLEVADLSVEYGSRLNGLFRAVDGVNLRVGPGQILGLVGESGSGKSTIGKAVLGLTSIAEGSIRIEDNDLENMRGKQRRHLRQRIGVVFQNPAMSLNPRYTARQAVAEPLKIIAGLTGKKLKARTESLLDAVGLADRAGHYAHELSGGQRQRVAIARAVTLDPVLLIADEPTSALDVSVQAQVLDVFRELQDRLGFACLFISHDLAVVDELCDQVAVLRGGQLMEYGPRGQVLSHPEHDYTKQLLASAPIPDPLIQRKRGVEPLPALP